MFSNTNERERKRFRKLIHFQELLDLQTVGKESILVIVTFICTMPVDRKNFSLQVLFQIRQLHKSSFLCLAFWFVEFCLLLSILLVLIYFLFHHTLEMNNYYSESW